MIMNNMKKQLLFRLLLLFFITSLAGALTATNGATIKMRYKPAGEISPRLYWIFFEEIHRAGEGGVFAEMVMNRSFEEGVVEAIQDGQQWTQAAQGELSDDTGKKLGPFATPVTSRFVKFTAISAWDRKAPLPSLSALTVLPSTNNGKEMSNIFCNRPPYYE